MAGPYRLDPFPAGTLCDVPLNTNANNNNHLQVFQPMLGANAPLVTEHLRTHSMYIGACFEVIAST